jgi:hypothetical protein
MAEPSRKVSYEESDLRALSKQISQPTKEFIQMVRKIQEQPSLLDDPLQLGHFAKSILEMHEATKIAKSLE